MLHLKVHFEMLSFKSLCFMLSLCCPQVESEVQKLYEYIYERGTIIPIEDYSDELLSVGDVSKRVTESIRCGTDEWESLVNFSPILMALLTTGSAL